MNKRASVLLFFFTVGYCTWFPTIQDAVTTSPYGFAPYLNLSVTLTADGAGLAVGNQLDHPINVSCNGIFLYSVEKGSISDFLECFETEDTVITIVTEGDTITRSYNVSKGEFYFLSVMKDGNFSNNITTSFEVYDTDSFCDFTSLSPYLVGLKTIKLTPLNYVCTIPIFPPEWHPVAGDLANFTGISYSYPNGKNYAVRKIFSFVLQPYWDSVEVQNKNGSTITEGDIITITGAFDPNDHYTCSFSSVDIQAFTQLTTNGFSSTCPAPPESAFVKSETLKFDIFEQTPTGTRTVLFIGWKGQPSFTYQEPTPTPSTNTPQNLTWIVVAAVIGLVVGCLFGGIIAVVARKIMIRRDYHAI